MAFFEQFRGEFEHSIQDLRQICLEKCGYSLGYDCIDHLNNPDMLETFAEYSTDRRKHILMFIGSAEKLWGKHSEAYLRSYLKTVVAKWGEEHLLVVVGGNDGKGTTYVVTKILAELYPGVRLFSIIPVVNKETRRAVCGMGVSTYEQDAPDRTLIPTHDGPAVFPDEFPDARSYWDNSFRTGAEMLTEPMQGLWGNHTVWPISHGGGIVRQQLMAWLVNFFKGECAVLEGGGGTLNEIRAFSTKTTTNPSPTINILINSSFLLSLMQKEVDALTAKTEEQGELLVDLAHRLGSHGTLNPALTTQIAELTRS